jgi:hypothetical protein
MKSKEKKKINKNAMGGTASPTHPVLVVLFCYLRKCG